jgi:Zn ribbon nucleic-acid-binding protein
MGRYSKKKFFNNGICKDCGGELRCADMDSQGGYLIECVDCGNKKWFSWYYNFVTHEEIRKEEKRQLKGKQLRKDRGL